MMLTEEQAKEKRTMPRAIIAIFPLMLVAGLGVGSAVTTLLWQGPMERRGKMVAEAQAQTEEALRIADRNLQTARSLTASLNECTATLRRVSGLTISQP